MRERLNKHGPKRRTSKNLTAFLQDEIISAAKMHVLRKWYGRKYNKRKKRSKQNGIWNLVIGWNRIKS